MIRHEGWTIDRVSNTISYMDRSVTFPRSTRHPKNNNRQFRFLEALILFGQSSPQQLFDALYKEDPDGGPLDGERVCYVVLSQMRPIFAKLGVRLVHGRVLGRRSYYLEPLEDVVRRTA